MWNWSGISVPPLHNSIRISEEPLSEGRIISSGMVTWELVHGIKGGGHIWAGLP